MQYGSKERGEQCAVLVVKLDPRTPFARRFSFAIVSYLMRTAKEHELGPSTHTLNRRSDGWVSVRTMIPNGIRETAAELQSTKHAI